MSDGGWDEGGKVHVGFGLAELIPRELAPS